MGRPSKLTPEVQEEICDYISKGNTFERACALVDVDRTTFFKWRQRGEAEKKGMYFDFLNAVKRAEERFKAYNVSLIQKAALESNHWQAAAWLLERKYPEEFGRRDKIELVNKIDEMVQEFREIK